MGLLDNLFGKKQKKNDNFIDIRKHPMEKKVIEDVVEKQNKDFMKPSAKLTINEAGKADVWLATKKWAQYNHEGIVLKNSGQYEEAIEKFDKAIAEEPRAGIPHHGKSASLLKMGDYEGSLKEANLAISLDKKIPEEILNKPAILEFYFGKIQALLRLGKYNDILDPEMEEYLMSHEPQGYGKGRDNAKEFLKILNKIKNSKPATSKVEIAKFDEQMDKVFRLVKSSDLSSALVEVEKAIAINPKDTRAHVTKALIVIGLKNTGKRKDDIEAGRELSLAVALEPRNPNIFFTSGMISLAGGDKVFASTQFVRVKFLDPKYIINKKGEKYKPFAACFMKK